LPSIKEECLLWEIDVDEFWTAKQIDASHQLFTNNPKYFSAFYWCHYFVGPNLVISTRNGYANNPSYEWERTWRYLPHFRWASHEPPILVEKTYSGQVQAVRNRGFFTHQETESAGLVFRHFAYVYESQLQFKEIYYGYRGAVVNWEKLQSNLLFPIKLSTYFDWVTDETMVDTAENLGIKPMDNALV
jgi:hypothetical protein